MTIRNGAGNDETQPDLQWRYGTEPEMTRRNLTGNDKPPPAGNDLVGGDLTARERPR